MRSNFSPFFGSQTLGVLVVVLVVVLVLVLVLVLVKVLVLELRLRALVTVFPMLALVTLPPVLLLIELSMQLQRQRAVAVVMMATRQELAVVMCQQAYRALAMATLAARGMTRLVKVCLRLQRAVQMRMVTWP